MADIDCFRAYNDTYGFSAGDTCLQRVAVAIDHCVNLAESLVARYGGEEFAIALPNLDEPQAIQLAEALRAQIQQLGIAHSSSLVRSPLLTLSFGVASIFPDRNTDINVLIDTAARALYLSKMHGRDRVTFLNYT
uniref:GGDEF domain-containing protein n=1 Tax=Desertifilum tharense IPPAS B-1220 TaxID=1781255 RepID=A0ACD5GRP2_9CYAN